MTTLRTAAQAMIQVLESADVDPHSSDAVYTAMAALKAALAEPEPLQQALVEADRIMGHDDEATEWRERWAWLFPGADERAAAKEQARAAIAAVEEKT